MKNIYNHPHLKKESVKAHAKVKLIAREREGMRKLKRDTYNHPHLKKESAKAHAKVKLIARERMYAKARFITILT